MKSGNTSRSPRKQPISGENPKPAFHKPTSPIGLPLLIAGLLIAGLIAYANSFTGVMLFDDESSIVKAQNIRQLWPLTAHLAQPRPVLVLTFAINYAVGGLDVLGYHVVNLAIHLLAGLALFGVIRRTLTLPRFQGAYERDASLLAFVVSLLWLIHPLQTGSVTYIVQRAESLMGLLYLTALYAVIRGAQAARGWPWYIGSILAFSVGIATKEVIVTAPIVFLLYDRVFLSTSWREVLRKRWAFYTLPYLPGVVWLFLRLLPVLTPSATDAVMPASAGLNVEGLTPWLYARTQPEIILHYLRLVFWPHPLILNYEWPVDHDSGGIFLSFLSIAVLIGISVWALKAYPSIGFLGLTFFILLAPTSSLIPIRDLAFEHRMYLPLACVLTLVIFGVRRVANRWRTPRFFLPGLLICVVLASVVGTLARNRDYQSPYTMWTSILDHYPRNYRSLANLGTASYREQKFEQALAYYTRAIEIKDDDSIVLYNLGMALQKSGKQKEAETIYRHAIDGNPPGLQASLIANQLGLIAIARKAPDEALAYFQKAVDADGTNAIAQKNLGLLYLRKQNNEGAANHLALAIRLKPDYADAYYWLGIVREQQGRPEEARAAFSEALRYDPSHKEAQEKEKILAP